MHTPIGAFSRRAVLGGAGALTLKSVLADGIYNPTGSAVSSVSVTAPVEQFFDRIVQLPSPTDQATYGTLINGLVSDGVWSSLDVLLVLAAPSAGVACTNLISSSFQPSFSDAEPTFTAYHGISTGGSVSYLNTNFNPSTAGGNYVRNSGMLGAWNLTTTAFAGALIRSIADVSSEIWPKDSGNMFWMVNSASEDSASNPNDASGWFVANRTGTAVTAAYRNNVQLGTSATVSVAPENNSLICGYGVTSSVWTMAAFAIGAGLSTSHLTALYSRLSACLTTFGAI